MDSKLLLLIGVLCVSGVLVLSAILFSRRKITAGRQPLSFEEIQRLSNAEVRIQTLTHVLTTLGKSYGLNPQLIRPNDHLQLFYDLDSWTLGLGTERINKWLADEGITGKGTQLVTVLDLMLFLERHRGNTGTSS